jgi:hypothetical protein
MAKKTWVLTDLEQNLNIEHIAIGPEQLGGQAAAYAVTKRTLQAGVSRGVEVVEVHNGRLRFVVLPTRGMGIWRADLGDLQLGWKSPV